MQLKRAEGLAWRKLGNETIIINLKRRMMYGLNAEGGKLWEALEKGIDRQGADSRVPEFSDEGFLSELASEGLLDVDCSIQTPESQAEMGPRIMWKEKVQQFAGGCGFQAGQGGICDSTPMNS